jgi:hypothetical protein
LRIIKKIVDVPLRHTEEQSIVTVHCVCSKAANRIRIWRSTYLVDRENKHRSKMLHAENIPFYPNWKQITGDAYKFTLYFAQLPKSCKAFDLHEIIPEPMGFLVQSITRNEMDVYTVNID